MRLGDFQILFEFFLDPSELENDEWVFVSFWEAQLAWINRCSLFKFISLYFFLLPVLDQVIWLRSDRRTCRGVKVLCSITHLFWRKLKMNFHLTFYLRISFLDFFILFDFSFGLFLMRSFDLTVILNFNDFLGIKVGFFQLILIRSLITP